MLGECVRVWAGVVAFVFTRVNKIVAKSTNDDGGIVMVFVILSEYCSFQCFFFTTAHKINELQKVYI